MQRRSVAAVVIVYNMHCEESITCRALTEIADENLLVLIFDNSTKDMGNYDYCAAHGWEYLGGNGNVGLSKAYNACIDYLKQTRKADVLCLFDDDTHVDERYFTMLREAMADAKEKIFVPLIYSGDKLISPNILNPGHKIVLFGDEETALSYDGDKISAINSCMALDLSLFSSYRYDENIFLDGVDHNFISDMKKRAEKIRVFPYRCNHLFSGDSRPPKNSAISRFRIFEKDFRYILRDDKKTYYRLIGKRVLKLTLQYKSLDFLRVVLRNKYRTKGGQL